MSFRPDFTAQLQHGTVVGVPLPNHTEVDESIVRLVAPEEATLAEGCAVRRLVTFVGGRLAMREALTAVGAPVVPVLRDDRGAPVVPPAYEASISHKDDYAVALVTKAADGWKVGVDVEQVAAPKTDISTHITTKRELALLATLSGEERVWQMMARFSIKEALYKALDPFVRRYVAFDEVDLDLLPDGRTEVRLSLAQGEGPFEVELNWLRRGPMVLSTAKVRPRKIASPP